MLRLMLRGMVVLALAFTVALGAIRAQPYADDGLRAFLVPPEGCPMPCWLGIQPGITTFEDALEILRAHPWIERAVFEEEPTATTIYLAWNQYAPTFLEHRGSLLPPFLWVDQDIVQFIVIPTNIPYAEVRLLVGAPNIGLFKVSGNRRTLTPDNPPNTTHAAMYFDRQVVIDTRVFCPVNIDVFWNAPVTITLNSPHTRPSAAGKQYDLAEWFYSEPCQS